MRLAYPSLAVLLCALSWSSVAAATPNPPQLVADLSPGTAGSFPSWSVVHDGDLFFAASTGGNDTELFRSDGTAAHTTKLSNVNPAQYSDGASRLFLAGNKICFDAQGGLWASDGTAAGTSIITPNLRDPRDLSRYPFLDPRVPYGGRMFIIADYPSKYGLWSTDGTSAGTKFVANAGTVLGVAGAGAGRVMFIDVGTLRATDGTTTVDVAPAGYYANRVGELGSTLYFTLFQGVNKFELWKTDGTGGGTSKVKTIPYNSIESPPPRPGVVDNGAGPVSVAHDGRLYFVVDDLQSKKIWVTDGTDAGTQLIGETFTASLVEAGGTLFFDLASPTKGHEVHSITTGATLATVVEDLIPGPNGSYPSDFTLWQGKATFIARTPAQQVYTTDGLTITPFGGPISTVDYVGATIEGASPKALYMNGYDPAHGQELWAAVDPSATPPPDAGTPGHDGGAGPKGTKSPDSGADDGASSDAPPAEETTSSASGCTTAGENGGAGGALMLLGALVVLRRRRR